MKKNSTDSADTEQIILVPRAHDPSGLWLGSRALAGPDFLSMRRVFISHSQLIRFARFDGKSLNRGLPVLDQTRPLDPNHRPEGSWALGTRMWANKMTVVLMPCLFLCNTCACAELRKQERTRKLCSLNEVTNYEVTRNRVTVKKLKGSKIPKSFKNCVKRFETVSKN